jgi:hypothetical protein
VFVDNVHPYPKCFGPKLGLHTHDWPDKNNIECYKMALRRVHDAVKSYGKDNVVLLNTGARSTEYADYGDCQMWESYCWRMPFDNGDKEPPVKGRRLGPRSLQEMKSIRQACAKLVERGVAVTALTYLPDPNCEPEHAFFAYASAKLAELDQWTATCEKRRDILRRLYRVRTGKATSDLVELGAGAAYRQFENALIVCNHATKPVEIKAPLPSSLRENAVELLEVRQLPTVEGTVALSLPAESGRVIVSRAAAFDNLLQEVQGQSLAARLHIEEKGSKSGTPDTATSMKELQDVESRAASLRKRVHDAAFPTSADCAAIADLDKAAAVVLPTSTSDAFLAERLDNMRRHAKLADRFATTH